MEVSKRCRQAVGFFDLVSLLQPYEGSIQHHNHGVEDERYCQDGDRESLAAHARVVISQTDTEGEE